jgi:hypothetical protein
MPVSPLAPDNVVDFTKARIARAIRLPAWTSLPPYVIFDTGPRYRSGGGQVIALPVKVRR